MRSVLVDAGPLIALADRSDKYHRRVAAYLRRFNGRLLTTWPVLADRHRLAASARGLRNQMRSDIVLP